MQNLSRPMQKKRQLGETFKVVSHNLWLGLIFVYRTPYESDRTVWPINLSKAFTDFKYPGSKESAQCTLFSKSPETGILGVKYSAATIRLRFCSSSEKSKIEKFILNFKWASSGHNGVNYLTKLFAKIWIISFPIFCNK